MDVLVALGDDDILITGSTPYDDDPESLRAILAEWTRNDSYAARVEHLQTGVGPNGSVPRLDATVVADDGVKDRVTGGPGREWFFAGAGDRITGRKAPELITSEARSTTFAFARSAPASAGTGESRPSSVAVDWSSALGDNPTSAKKAFGLAHIPEFTIEDELDRGMVTV